MIVFAKTLQLVQRLDNWNLLARATINADRCDDDGGDDHDDEDDGDDDDDVDLINTDLKFEFRKNPVYQ